MKSWAKIFLVLALGLWLLTGCAIISRIQLVFDYATLPLVPPEYEVVAGTASAIGALACALAVFLLAILWGDENARTNRRQGLGIASSEALQLTCWLTASFPLGFLLMRIFGVGAPQPGWWELAWFAGWTGLAARITLENRKLPFAETHGLWIVCLTAAIAGCSAWWFWQSMAYHADHQLGFNDFGHFTQRVSNTANGNGFLLESPILPPFWDHFNPGLLFIVPFWCLCPRVELIFAIQAICLAVSAGLVAAIARAKGQSAASACGWGCAWLLYPSIGQMNLAYTYGWHPITLAIPCLLAAQLFLVRGRIWIAVPFAVLAASFEEGVWVVIACYGATQSLRAWLHRTDQPNSADSIGETVAKGCDKAHPTYYRNWMIAMIVAVVGFICVYQFSGLAPFQTARFAKLGRNAFEISASPLLRPDVFWGLLFRPRNAAFATLLLLPFLIVGSRSWLWSLSAVAPPLLVLMIWEHMPAQSLAFQYASCLIPILFVGIIESSTHLRSPGSRAFGMLATAWILSISIGQMPWSNDSLIDVKAKTYGVEVHQKPHASRVRGSKDAQWIDDRIESLKRPHETGTETGKDKGPSSAGKTWPKWDQLRVLATGRLASRFVGVRDIETVGQFWQRYDALQSLDPSLASPILRYDVMLLDFHESFQQTPEETVRTLREAEKHGWTRLASGFDFLVLTREGLGDESDDSVSLRGNGLNLSSRQ